MKTKNLNAKILIYVVIVCMLMTGLSIFAYEGPEEITKDGVIYRITDGYAEAHWTDESYTGDIIIPSTVNGYPVKITNTKFLMATGAKNVTIPSGVTEIESNSFIGAKNLENIFIPKTVMRINGLQMSTGNQHLYYIDKGRQIHIYYEGSQSNWENIEINTRVEDGLLVIHYNSKGIGNGESGKNAKAYSLKIVTEKGENVGRTPDVRGINKITGETEYVPNTGDIFVFTAVLSENADDYAIWADKYKINEVEGHMISREYLKEHYNLKEKYNSDGTKTVTWKMPIYNEGLRTFDMVINGKRANIAVDIYVYTYRDDIKVTFKGAEMEFEIPPQIINGRTMVPVRAIFEAMGAEVKWNPDEKKVLATKWYEPTQGIVSAVFFIGEKYMLNSFGEMRDEIDTPALIINGRTFVPARAAAEAFNYTVGWDENTKTVKITKNY